MAGRAVEQTHEVWVQAEVQSTPCLSRGSVNTDPSVFVSVSMLGAISQLGKLMGAGVT